MVRTLCDVLTYKGWAVRSAFSGEEAVNLAMTEHFDIVLMDIAMPGIDGVDALQIIRKRCPGTRVVLMTAYAAPERIMIAEQSGVMRVLSKPVNVSLLLDLLANALSASGPILLVDTDAVFLKTMSEVLQLRGYPIVQTTSVDDATFLVTQRKPIALLLHTNVGVTPLHDVVEKVHDVGPTVAMILYSGRAEAQNELYSQVPPEWVHAYLQKPFAVDDIVSVLDDIRAAS
jgi:DNA-binding NtrC family response regulator